VLTNVRQHFGDAFGTEEMRNFFTRH
jgi:hypothetical protein